MGTPSQLRILIVEDNVMLAEVLAELLEMLGHAVCAIEHTEAAAVRAATQHAPDLVIMDIQLAEGTGPGAMATILRSGPVAHVFMGGAVPASTLAGAVVLQKPFRGPELEGAIKRALGMMSGEPEIGNGLALAPPASNPNGRTIRG